MITALYVGALLNFEGCQWGDFAAFCVSWQIGTLRWTQLEIFLVGKPALAWAVKEAGKGIPQCHDAGRVSICVRWVGRCDALWLARKNNNFLILKNLGSTGNCFRHVPRQLCTRASFICFHGFGFGELSFGHKNVVKFDLFFESSKQLWQTWWFDGHDEDLDSGLLAIAHERKPTEQDNTRRDDDAPSRPRKHPSPLRGISAASQSWSCEFSCGCWWAERRRVLTRRRRSRGCGWFGVQLSWRCTFRFSWNRGRKCAGLFFRCWSGKLQFAWTGGVGMSMGFTHFVKLFWSFALRLWCRVKFGCNLWKRQWKICIWSFGSRRGINLTLAATNWNEWSQRSKVNVWSFCTWWVAIFREVHRCFGFFTNSNTHTGTPQWNVFTIRFYSRGIPFPGSHCGANRPSLS